jgi:hypothetical protein
MDAWILVALMQVAAPAQPDRTETCGYDRAAMLALDEQAFDQDLNNGGGGWRRIEAIPGCQLAAAELLRDYRVTHHVDGVTMAWHEGQMRAAAGQYREAIELFDSAHKPENQANAGWNAYVDASIAFLRRDRAALEAARTRVAAVPYPQGSGLPPLNQGYIEFPAEAGRPPMKMRWPPNIDVVDGLLHCFSESYAVALNEARCRQPAEGG